MQANQGFLGNFRTGTFFIRFYKKDKNDLPKIPRYTENFLFVCFFLCVLFVLNLFYSSQRGSNGFITETTIYTFPRNQRGSNILRGGIFRLS